MRLNFTPAYKQESDTRVDRDYYAQDRENMCVVCGNKDDFAKFSVVPKVYKEHLPETLKKHCSHDVLLLCFGCREKASQA